MEKTPMTTPTPTLTRRERRRRRAGIKMEDESQKTIENLERDSHVEGVQSSEKLVRRGTYTVIRPGSDGEDSDEQRLKVTSWTSGSSPSSDNNTYIVNENSEESKHTTYNVEKEDSEDIRPIPLPRKRKSKEPEKTSSDTDKDVTEIDLDDMRVKSEPESAKSLTDTSASVVIPIPKPRKLSIRSPTSPPTGSLNTKTDKPETEKQEAEEENKTLEKDELPLVSDLQKKESEDGKKPETDKRKTNVTALLDRKQKKRRKTFASMMKLDTGKIPKISGFLKEFKDGGNNEKVEETKIDFQIDSPRYPESVQNGKIYVQNKNGFRVMERDDVLNSNPENGANDRMPEESTVKTAILFQKYWSRSMTYFHGILAGFALSHAATVAAIMLRANYDPGYFIPVYSCLSLKIHFIFYTLTVLCIVSCFDRIDVGHMNRKHWQIAWKVPSMWLILACYIISFGLTFANQKTEARFDAYLHGNETEEAIWGTQEQYSIQASLLTWYHTVWARDVLLLFAWLLISLTNFSDFLLTHLTNMVKYTEVNDEDSLRRISRQKTDFF